MKITPATHLSRLLFIASLFMMPAGYIQAALKPEEILTTLSPKEIETRLPGEPPESYYLYASRLMKAGDNADALRWAYIGQLRYRIYLQAHPGQDPGRFRSLGQSIGSPLDHYGAAHTDQWLAAIDGALAWDDAHDNAASPKDKFATVYAAQRAGMAKLKAFIVSNAGQLKARANGAMQPGSGGLTVVADVRKASLAGDTLFRDLLSAPGGVAMADGAFYPNAKKREIVKIEVMVPYDNKQTGVERWTVSHDGVQAVSYVVKLVPDGRGGTTFSVAKDVR